MILTYVGYFKRKPGQGSWNSTPPTLNDVFLDWKNSCWYEKSWGCYSCQVKILSCYDHLTAAALRNLGDITVDSCQIKTFMIWSANYQQLVWNIFGMLCYSCQVKKLLCMIYCVPAAGMWNLKGMLQLSSKRSSG